MLRLLAEAIYWTHSRTFGWYESFTHHNMEESRFQRNQNFPLRCTNEQLTMLSAAARS